MNWLDFLIILVLGIGVIKGLFDGLIKQIVSLISFILAVFFAGKTAKPLRDFLVGYDSITNVISPHIITVICYILAFTLIIFIFKCLGNLLNKTMVSTVSCLNYILGGFLGAFLSILFLSLIFNVLTVIDSDSKILKGHAKEKSALFYKIEKIVPFISPFIKEAHEMKEKIKPINKILVEFEKEKKE